MPKAELRCLLCGTKSTAYTTPGNLFVRCPICGWYRLSYRAHERFFMGHGSPVLTAEQKKGLSAYVKRESADDPAAPVELNVEVIEELVGILEN